MQNRYSGVPEGASGEMERRSFLKLGGIGLAGAAIVGGGFTSVRRALAQDSGGSSTGSLRREFETAASEYGVPVEVLLAMGYVNTRWEMPPPQTTDYAPGESEGKGTFGIMALVENPSTDTVGEASALTGIPESQLKTDRASNIRGGAALLAEASGVDPTKATKATKATEGFSDTMSRATDDLDAMDPRSVDRFTNTVSGAVDDLTESVQAVSEGLSNGEAVAGVGGGELYAEQVRNTLRTGASATISSGERVTLAPAGQ